MATFLELGKISMVSILIYKINLKDASNSHFLIQEIYKPILMETILMNTDVDAMIPIHV